MIRQTPRPVRVGAALTGIAGALALAGCAGTTATTDEAAAPTSSATLEASATSEATAEATTGGDAAASTSTYVDGTYTAAGSYATPESVEEITVTVTLADDVITAVEVTGSPQKRESVQYQGEFIGGISAEVVGQDIDSLNVSRVAGSSLTSGGFTQAIEAIKADAAA